MNNKKTGGCRNRIEIAPQALIFAAGVLLSVMLISVMVGQFEDARSLSAAVSENMLRATQDIRDSGVMQYDGLLVRGSDVINICRRYVSDNDLRICIDYAGSGRRADAVTIEAALVSELRDSTSGLYVRPSGRFRCDVERNANDVITGMIFTAS